jgi:alpha-glucuronidase
MRLRQYFALLIAICGASFLIIAHAEDGYDLWLRYRPLTEMQRKAVADHVTGLVMRQHSPTLNAAHSEIDRALSAMLGAPPKDEKSIHDNGELIVGTAGALPMISVMGLPLASLGKNGYIIRSVQIHGYRATVIAANDDLGALYGTFAFIKQIQTGHSLNHLDIISSPKLQLRLLDHWDNIDRTRERGYSGASIWDWWTLPDYAKPRYTDYARANASIGINGTVLNNVNASADMLTHRYLVKVAKLADIFRPYGIKVYLSAKFSAPIEIGNLKTADPLNPKVRKWWKDKADEIYRLIPDFGGFLVKANSEGQPGPQDYHRTHAQGANMIAGALAPHGGIVMWRAFVYSAKKGSDRAAQAYNAFKPLDGKFQDNVLVQVKNGPIDFQPREPFSPLFGAMPNTPLMMEFQITKEYLGQATHLVYLGALFKEVLGFDTHAYGKGSTVANVLEGKRTDKTLTGMAGVSNIGADRDWTGGAFNQANWYAMGRFAWNPQADPRKIAANWAKMTFSTNPAFVKPVVNMMMLSREAVVNYMTPLGLAHQMATGSHYGPGPWINNLSRPERDRTYYNKANASGIGFDRTETGSNEIAQYSPQVQKLFADPYALDEKYLLWFHHEPWTFRMSSGKTLWDSLVDHYDLGVSQVADMQATWAKMKPYVDKQRFTQVSAFLGIQHREALWWRNACIAYFQSLSKLPLPQGHAEPPHDLPYYEAISYPHAPG